MISHGLSEVTTSMFSFEHWRNGQLRLAEVDVADGQPKAIRELGVSWILPRGESPSTQSERLVCQGAQDRNMVNSTRITSEAVPSILEALKTNEACLRNFVPLVLRRYSQYPVNWT